MVTLAAPAKIPSLEPAMQAAVDVITSLWTSAAAAVTALSPSAAAVLDAPAAYRLIVGGYDLPDTWPTVIVGGSNLRRVSQQTNPALAGDWRGVLEFHAWLEDGDDPSRLARSLERYAATIWLCLVSADLANALGGARLCPETFAIARGPDAGQSLAQQSIVLVVEVTLRA